MYGGNFKSEVELAGFVTTKKVLCSCTLSSFLLSLLFYCEPFLFANSEDHIKIHHAGGEDRMNYVEILKCDRIIMD